MKKFIFNLTVLFLKIVSRLPFPLLYLVSDVLYFFLYYIIRYRRDVVRTNLQNAFPGKKPEEREDIERRFYAFLADMIMESVKSISITEKQLRQRYQFENLEAITKHLERGRPVVAVSGHYGNWEWGSLGIGLELGNQAIVVYKPLSNKDFDQLTRSVRSRFGTALVPMKHTLRKLTEYQDRPFVLALVGDQTPIREESHLFLPFLNQPTAVYLGIEKIAKKIDGAIVYFNVYRYKRGYYTCQIKSLVEFPETTDEHEITRMHLAELENIIRTKPEFWLWSHRRWKFKPAEVL